MPVPQFERVEANVRRLSQTFTDLPVTEVLLARAVTMLGRDINAMLERELKPSGLAEPEFRLLMALSSHGGSSFAGDICAALAQSPANLTRLSDSLVERGLIARNPDLEDRRRMLLTLQPAGEQLVRTLMPRIAPEIAAAFADFTAVEKKQLLASLKRLMAGIDAINAAAASAREAGA
jgi:MarR family transcriptional regulator, negative regulator of the multidrug operon emrRAB